MTTPDYVDLGATCCGSGALSAGNKRLATRFGTGSVRPGGSADPNACDQDQGSHPIVGPDGRIYVAFGNGNTPGIGTNQVMMVSCPATADCSNQLNWTAPAKVGDLIGIHPIGPSAAGCPGGRR